MQNVVVHEDLRVRRTRKLIQGALIKLTVEKGYGAITVQDIVDRAVINRSTFYRHYLDKNDLLTKYMDEVTALTSEDDNKDLNYVMLEKEVPSGLVKLLKHTCNRQLHSWYQWHIEWNSSNVESF